MKEIKEKFLLLANLVFFEYYCPTFLDHNINRKQASLEHSLEPLNFQKPVQVAFGNNQMISSTILFGYIFLDI